MLTDPSTHLSEMSTHPLTDNLDVYIGRLKTLTITVFILVTWNANRYCFTNNKMEPYIVHKGAAPTQKINGVG